MNKPNDRSTERKCKYCGKKLIERQKKFCSQKCNGRSMNQKLGHNLWDRDKLKSYWVKLKYKEKNNTSWLARNGYSFFTGAIAKEYGKNAWSKFMNDVGVKPIQDHINPLPKRFIGWLREEQDVKIGDTFVYSSRWGIPGENSSSIHICKMLEKLLDKEVIKIIKKGGGGGTTAYPTQYQLLKTRI